MTRFVSAARLSKDISAGRRPAGRWDTVKTVGQQRKETGVSVAMFIWWISDQSGDCGEKGREGEEGACVVKQQRGVAYVAAGRERKHAIKSP